MPSELPQNQTIHSCCRIIDRFWHSSTFEPHVTSAGRVSMCQVELVETLKILTPEPFLFSNFNKISILPKLGVAGSIPVSRSILSVTPMKHVG